MNESLIQIENTIGSELTLGKKFLALVRDKKDAIIKNDVPIIASLSAQMNETVEELEELGFSRQDQVLSLTKENDTLNITESLRDLVAQLTDSTKEKFTLLREELLVLYKEISEEVALNGELLAQTMKFSKHVFDRLTSIDRQVKNGNYGRHGKTGKSASTPTVLGKKG